MPNTVLYYHLQDKKATPDFSGVVKGKRLLVDCNINRFSIELSIKF